MRAFVWFFGAVSVLTATVAIIGVSVILHAPGVVRGFGVALYPQLLCAGLILLVAWKWALTRNRRRRMETGLAPAPSMLR